MRMPRLPLLMRRMFPRDYSGRKPELSFDLYPKSEGPFQPPSCLLWVPSEGLSIEREGIEQLCALAMAQRHRPRSPRGIHCTRENRKCPFPVPRLDLPRLTQQPQKATVSNTV